jgi:hypothetical protein
MQATTTSGLFRRNSPPKTTVANSSLVNHRGPISVPEHLFRKLIDFLEDRSETKVIRRKNAFYCAAQPNQPIAWLNSQEIATIVLRDASTGNRNTIQVRIEDIQLPKPIRVEHTTYQSLLCQLVRSSGGGVVRWFNKFYSSVTGCVLAELISSERIKFFKTQGPFGVSSEIEFKQYAAIEVPKAEYLRLLNFLEQERGDEVARIGNTFYSRETAELLRTALRSPATVDQETANLLNFGALAELVSKENVRLSDGTTKVISGLVLRNRIFRRHLYFCASCQSFIRQPYRSTFHAGESGKHSLTYVSSCLFMVPETKRRASRKQTKFPEILYRFWGIEKGKLADNRRISRKQSHPMINIPTDSTSLAPVRARRAPETTLILTADICIDEHIVTAEERIEAIRRLEAEDNGTAIDQQLQRPVQQSPIETPQEIPSSENFRENTSPARVRKKLRKRNEVKAALKIEAAVGLPELDLV